MSSVPFMLKLAPAMMDENVRAQWLSDPRAALEGIGVEVPEWVEVNVVEGEKVGLTISLAPMIDVSELSEEQLERISGGGCSSSAYCF